ncbi:MAG: hypothetical protein QXI07_10095 [Pyrobaculum sp.]|uniref:hypothetical protein n=1 Tax=Pyrobaculum sp. TaxID=2004705 RepID=UPI00317A2CA3
MRLTPALAALAVAAIVAAIDTGALQNTLGEMQNTAITVLQIFYKSIPVIALGLLALWALARRDIDTLMRSVWFYVIITAFVVWLVLGLAARVSPEFAPLYQQITGNGCPFYWCP